MDDITQDAMLGGRLHLFQPRRGHRAGSDAVLLAAAAPVEPGACIADFGAGVGTAGLAVLLRVPGTHASLVELHPPTAELARRNVASNALEASAEVVEGDVVDVAPTRAPFDCVIANPPFHPPGGRASPDDATALARTSGEGMIEGWMRSAARLLKPDGRFAMIHRPDALRPILDAADGRFGAVELLAVHARPDQPAVRLVLRGRRGSRAPLRILPPLVLMDEAGRFTPRAEAIHRDLASL